MLVSEYYFSQLAVLLSKLEKEQQLLFPMIDYCDII